MKNLFLYFFRNSKHIFWQVKKNFFFNSNDVVKFIKKKTGKLFSFNFSYRKSQYACICFIIILQKKYENRDVPSRVLNPGNSAKCMTLPKAGLGSLHLFRDGMTLKAPKLFPTIVHAGLVGHPNPHHYRLRAERVQFEWKYFTSPYGDRHLTRAGY